MTHLVSTRKLRGGQTRVSFPPSLPSRRAFRCTISALRGPAGRAAAASRACAIAEIRCAWPPRAAASAAIVAGSPPSRSAARSAPRSHRGPDSERRVEGGRRHAGEATARAACGILTGSAALTMSSWPRCTSGIVDQRGHQRRAGSRGRTIGPPRRAGVRGRPGASRRTRRARGGSARPRVPGSHGSRSSGSPSASIRGPSTMTGVAAATTVASGPVVALDTASPRPHRAPRRIREKHRGRCRMPARGHAARAGRGVAREAVVEIGTEPGRRPRPAWRRSGQARLRRDRGSARARPRARPCTARRSRIAYGVWIDRNARWWTSAVWPQASASSRVARPASTALCRRSSSAQATRSPSAPVAAVIAWRCGAIASRRAGSSLARSRSTSPRRGLDRTICLGCDRDRAFVRDRAWRRSPRWARAWPRRYDSPALRAIWGRRQPIVLGGQKPGQHRRGAVDGRRGRSPGPRQGRRRRHRRGRCRPRAPPRHGPGRGRRRRGNRARRGG